MRVIFLDRCWVVHIPLLVWPNLNFLHISKWIILPTQSCLVLYSCANLLHSLNMWLIDSFLSQHSQHLLFCFVLSIPALIWLVLMALFYAAIRRDFVSLLKFPFLSHVQVVSCEMFFIGRCFSSHFCFLVIVILLTIALSIVMAIISPPSCFSM